MNVCGNIGILSFIVIGFILYCVVVGGAIKEGEIDIDKLLYNEDKSKVD